MNVKFCLAFPCEAVSVPVMRRVLGDTLRNLGVVDECVGDILVAVTEACTNVLRHGGSARRYEVVTNVGPGGCLVEVVDSGQGFSPRRPRRTARAGGDHGVQPAERAGSRDARAQDLPAPRRARILPAPLSVRRVAGMPCARKPPSRKPPSRKPGSQQPGSRKPSRNQHIRRMAVACRSAPRSAARPQGRQGARTVPGHRRDVWTTG